MDPMHPLLTMFQSSCCLKDLQKTCDVVSKCVKLFGFHLCCLAKQSTKGVQLLRPVQDWVSLQALQTFLLFPPLRNFENNHIINLLTPCKRFCPLPTVNTGQQKLRILLLCIYIYISYCKFLSAWLPSWTGWLNSLESSNLKQYQTPWQA
jgi:hypothetical protein